MHQSQRDRKIASDINALIMHINPKANQKFKQDIRDYSRKLLASTLGSGTHSDPAYMKSKIIDKLSKKQNAKAMIKCQDALNKFLQLNSNSIKKKGQILKCLFKIAQNNEKANQAFQSMFQMKSKHTNVSMNQTQASQNFQNNTNIRRHPHSQIIDRIRDRGDKQHNINQNQILRDITFSLNNIGTNLIIQDNHQYVLSHNVNVTQPTRKIIQQLARVGKLYRNISQIKLQQGVISKALLGGFNQQKNQYLRWLTVIQQMVKAEQMNLRKLILWVYQPIERLKWLNRIMMAVQNFHGSQIISIINCHRPNGDYKANNVLNNMVCNLLQPFFQYMYSWVYKGELIDQYNQFFIKQNKNPKSQWEDRFYIQQTMIPNIIDFETAYRIFNTGRTMHFLKNRCKVNYIIKKQFFDTKTILQQEDSTNILSSNFMMWLKAVDHQTNQVIVKVLFENFKLNLHLDAMKKFFLGGQGDFIQFLADTLKEQLSLPKQKIYQFNLQGYILDAAKVCFPISKALHSQARQFRTEIVPRLLSKKIGDQATDGWDLFNYEYSIEQPISTILSPQNIANYQRIFSFIWKVKKVEQGLKDVWLKQTQNYRNCSKQTKNIFHYCHMLRNSMNHFLKNINSYLMIAIESIWDGFLMNLNQSNNFDEIISIHSAMLNKVLDISFCTLKNRNISQALHMVFIIISDFVGIQTKYYQDLEQYYERVRKYENDRRLQSRGLGGYSQISNQQSIISEINLQVPIFDHGNAKKKFEKLAKLYNQTFKQFYDMIKKDHEGLNILIFRLDFNDYYTTIENEIM